MLHLHKILDCPVTSWGSCLSLLPKDPSQVCFFDREGQKNKIIMAVTDGKLVLKEFPESLLRRFKREGVDNPLLCSLLNQQLGKDADREVET